MVQVVKEEQLGHVEQLFEEKVVALLLLGRRLAFVRIAFTASLVKAHVDIKTSEKEEKVNTVEKKEDEIIF